MSRKGIHRRFGLLHLKVVAAAVAALAVVGVVGGCQKGLLLASAQETRSNTPVSSYSMTGDPKQLPVVSGKSAEPSGSTDANSNDATTPAPAASVVPGIKADSGDKCPATMNKAQQDYNRDVQKQKSNLDSVLSIRVGLSISSQYIDDYNSKVTDIFNQYLSSAKAQNCTWPVKSPALLPSTYLP